MSQVEVYEPGEVGATVTLFGTDNPAEVIERATTVATTLARLVRTQKLVVRIGQSDHVRVEGWTLLGSMLGVFPVVEWTRPVMAGDERVGWEARVEARTRNGEVVGAAEAECLRDERTWKGRDDYALRSMAQTRAVSKAMRLPLGFVMQLAGFEPTPAEEMPVVQGRVVEPPAEEWDGWFPPPDEVAGEGASTPETPTPADAASPVDGSPAAVISDSQRRRLRAIQRASGVTDEKLKAMVWAIAGVTSSKDIGRDQYDALISAVEAEAPPGSVFAARADAALAARAAQDAQGDAA